MEDDTITGLCKKVSVGGRAKFIKYFNLPIIMTMSPYFEYFIDLYDSTLNTFQKLRWFIEGVNELGEKKWVQLLVILKN